MVLGTPDAREGHEPMPDEIREPPKNINAERTVLGSALIDNTTINTLIDRLTKRHFYPTAHQVIFAVIGDLHDANASGRNPVDVVSVGERLHTAGKLALIGGRSYLAGLEEDVLTTQNIEYYCDLLDEALALRDLLESSYKTIERVHAQDANAQSIIDTTGAGLKGIARITVKETLVRVGDAIFGVIDQLEADKASDKPIGLQTRLSALDRFTRGMRDGEPWVFQGKTSEGKSAAAMTVAMNIAMQPEPKATAYFSLEMPLKKMITRFTAMATRISALKLRDPRDLSDSEMALIWEVSGAGIKDTADPQAMASWPVWIDDTSSGVSAASIKTRCEILMETQPLSLIIVDTIQYTEPPDIAWRDKGHERIAATANALRTTAKELDIPMLILSQVNSDGDAFGSSAIRDNAEVIINIRRIPDDVQQATEYTKLQAVELTFKKGRDVGTGKVPIAFDRAPMLFVDAPPGMIVGRDNQ